MVSFCGAHIWQLGYLWDVRVPCRAHGSKQAVGTVPNQTQHALVKHPLLTKHGPQTARHPGRKKGEVWAVGSCKPTVYKPVESTFFTTDAHTPMHTPKRTALKHTCAHFCWNSAFAKPSLVSFFCPRSRNSLLLTFTLTHSCWGERSRWKAEVIRKGLSVTLWLQEALSFPPHPSLLSFVLSLFSPVS